jgi:hypothetical protein
LALLAGIRKRRIQRGPGLLLTIPQRSQMNPDDEAEAFLQSRSLEETQSYLIRGRRFSEVLPDELAARWVIAFKAWAAVRDDVHRREMDDLSAELRLHDLPLPKDQVQAEIAAIAKEIEQAGPDSLSDEARQRIADFMAARRKPAN